MDNMRDQKISYDNELKDKIVASIIDDSVNNLHSRKQMKVNSNDDVYSSVQNLGYELNRNNNFNTLNTRLNRKSVRDARIKVLQKLLDEYTLEQELYDKQCLKEQIQELGLEQTANHKFMVNSEGKYYRVYDNYVEEEPLIANVEKDGSYTVKEKITNSSDYKITKYNNEDKPIAIKITSKDEKAYRTEVFVAKKLKLKKELVNKYKLHGYSGNASGLTATIGNMITKPVPSGCYFHENYNFYKWNMKTEQFEIQIRQGVQVGSPMLADYLISENTVIRTDYDGAGMYL